MHDHLRDLGREMADELSPRMWRLQDIESMGLEGFQSILSANWRCFGSVEESSMNATIRYFIGNSNGWSHTSTSLLWLEIHCVCDYENSTQMRSIPSWIPLQNLQYLAILNGYLIRLWESDIKQPSSLKELEIENTNLEEFPDLSGMSNHLERVVLNWEEIPIEWFSFVESLKPANLSLDDVDATFESSSSHLRLTGLEFRGLVALNNKGQSPTVESPMSSLRKVELKSQHSVTKVLISGYHYPNLESLHLGDMKNLTDVDLISVTTLVCLELTACYNLKSISGISDLTNLKVLKIKGCSEIEELPGLSHLSCLNKVSIGDCEKLKGVSGISHLTNLKVLKIKGCLEIEELPVLSHLELYECANFKVYISDLPKLVKISIHHCSKLETVIIKGCEKLQNIAGIEEWPTLKHMEIPLCNGVAIRNFIHSLQRVPCEHMMVIESAAEGAESTLGHLFSQWIAAEEVIQLGFHEDNLVETMAHEGSLGGIIYCAVFAIHPLSLKVIMVGSSLASGSDQMDIMEFIDQENINYFIANYWLRGRTICLASQITLEKGYMVMVKKGEEWKTLPIIKIISDHLGHHGHRTDFSMWWE